MLVQVRSAVRRALLKFIVFVLIRSPRVPVHGRFGAYLERRLVRDAKSGGNARRRALAAVSRGLTGREVAAYLLAARVRAAAGDATAMEALEQARRRWPDAMTVPVEMARHAKAGKDREAVSDYLLAALACTDVRGVDPDDLLDLAIGSGYPSLVQTVADRLENWPQTLSVATTERVQLSAAMATAALGTDSGSEGALLRAVAQPGMASTALRWIMALDDKALLRRAALTVQPELVNPSTALSVADALRRSGDFTVSTELAQRVLEAHPDNPRAHRLVAVGMSSQRLAERSWQGGSVKHEPAYQPAERSISYLLHNSLPYASAGYATRTHGLLAALVRDDWQVHAATRLGYPYDTWDQDDTRSISMRDAIDGVSYHRLLDGRRPYLKWPVEAYVDDYANHVVEMARKHRVGLIHGASNFRNGFAAITAARRLGLPSIYEVRGLWELTRMSREPEYAHSEMFALTATLEAAACREADRVLAITAALRDEMVSRGVPNEKIIILPNGVDTSRFNVRQRDHELAAELGVTDKVVVGYVGSILDYEGIDLLLEAMAVLRRRRDDFHLLVVGDGAAYDDVVALAERSGVLDFVTFTGRVPHDQVERYYSLVDIAPFPRKPLPVCEAVSPLKPFEAMAMGKVPVVSSVTALTEIVDDGENGLVFTKGDVGSLVEVLDRLIGDRQLRARLGDTAREWVVRERDWSVLVKILESVYTELMTARPGRPKIGV